MAHYRGYPYPPQAYYPPPDYRQPPGQRSPGRDSEDLAEYLHDIEEQLAALLRGLDEMRRSSTTGG